MHQWVGGDRLFACPMDVGEALKYLLEGQSQLHFGDSRSQAFVYTMTKRYMFVDIISMHIKRVRIGEDVSITVSSSVPKY